MPERRTQVALALALAVVVAALVLPLGIAAAVLYSQDWAPVFDMALTELRVRDVGTARTPLVGLIGRLGTMSEPAHHPGPISFYLLAPLYRLLGGTAWALQAATATLNALAIALAVAVAWRSRSLGVVAFVGLGLALAMQGYGATALTEPWNPNFPVLWFSAFLVASWSVLAGDVAVLPVVVATASICAQTHIPYAAVCGGIGGVVALLAAVNVLGSARGSRERSLGLRQVGTSILVGAVLWTPPIIEELIGPSGNLSRLRWYFTDPEHRAIGFLGALPVVLSRLDAPYILIEQWLHPGGFAEALPEPSPHPRPGALSFIVWVVAALAALGLRNRRLLALHGLVATSLAVFMTAASRIIGGVYNHILMWGFQIGIALLLACVATAVAIFARVAGTQRLERIGRIGHMAPAVAAGAVVLATLRFAGHAALAEPSTDRQTWQLSQLASQVRNHLRAGSDDPANASSRYVVSWSDPLYSGALAIGLVNELERDGVAVKFDRDVAPLVGFERTTDTSWATARLHFATGSWIAETRRVDGAAEVAWIDPRSDADRREAARIRDSIVALFRGAEREDLVKRSVHDLPGAVAAYPDGGGMMNLATGRLVELGGPAAIFLLPPDQRPVKTDASGAVLGKAAPEPAPPAL